jgi:hypothetical protein
MTLWVCVIAPEPSYCTLRDYESLLVLTENSLQPFTPALQSMVITKQPQIGGEGTVS